jgi:NADH dehydrogenase
MRVLVTGGSGVIGEGLIPELLTRGHAVRLLTRGAAEAVRQWPAGVESYAADVSDEAALYGAADGCDAVVHIAGIVAEQPPALTFDRINVDGTRLMLDEARRAGAARFVYISSLGAERGASAYHQSKREAEALVRTSDRSWIILRPGNVYGPGDDVMSQLLTMHRTMPVVPVIGAGDHEFQPIWYRDLGQAIAIAVERDDLQDVFELAGEDRTTPAEVLSRFAALTGRRPLRVPVPETVAALTARVAAATGLPSPITESTFQMLVETNVLRAGAPNALQSIFGVTPTALHAGLAMLADVQPEQTPDQGVGALNEKHFWADIVGGAYDAEGLLEAFRARAIELMPVDLSAEPGAPDVLAEGATLTGSLPVRGHFQVRVEEVTAGHITMATLRGHPLAGIVRFTSQQRDAGTVRFSVSVYARAATTLDWLAMGTVGETAQRRNWTQLVERVVDLSQGTSEGPRSGQTAFDAATASTVEREIADLIARRKLADHQSALAT